MPRNQNLLIRGQEGSLLIQNKSGIALLTAMAAMSVMLYISSEVSFDSLVEYSVNSQALHRMRAYYAAKNGVDLSLFRIKLYYQVQNVLGGKLDQGMIDQVYKFPLAWPLPIPPDMGSIDKDDINKSLKESIMVGSFLTTIEDEGSKIDIGALASNSKALREATVRQLVQIFENKKETDEDFRKKYDNYDFTELINQIGDYASSKRSSFNGGDKRAPYQNIGLKDFPPNRMFRTIEELHFVPKMTEEFYQILLPHITIYGTRSINPNNASRDVLRSLNKGFTDEIATAIIKRRDDPELGGPFKDVEDFWNYVEREGLRLEDEAKKEEIPIGFAAISSFRIRSIGEFNGVSREINAIVLNLHSAAASVKQIKDQEKKEAQDANGSNSQGGNNQQPDPAGDKTPPKIKIDKGPPRIVYWQEK